MQPEPAGGDGLAVAAILHVAAREHSRHSREDVLLASPDSLRIGFKLAFEHFGVRDVADAEKHCARGEVPSFRRSSDCADAGR